MLFRSDSIKTISLNESFEVQLYYNEDDFNAVSELEKWTPLSEHQLSELSTLLLNYYDPGVKNASPSKRLTRLNEIIDTNLSKGSRWYSRKDVVVKGDRLIVLLEEANYEVHAYYLTP